MSNTTHFAIALSTLAGNNAETTKKLLKSHQDDIKMHRAPAVGQYGSYVFNDNSVLHFTPSMNYVYEPNSPRALIMRALVKAHNGDNPLGDLVAAYTAESEAMPYLWVKALSLHIKTSGAEPAIVENYHKYMQWDADSENSCWEDLIESIKNSL